MDLGGGKVSERYASAVALTFGGFVRATCLLLCTCGSWLSGTSGARANDADVEVYARVVVSTAGVRAGPSTTYRQIYRARHDEVFPVRGRATSGYWFRIELPDATEGYIQGDAVYNHEVGEAQAKSGRFLPAVFAPPPLPSAHGEIALIGGALGAGGFVALRPAWLLDPSFGIELSAGASVARGGRLMMLLAGPVVNFFPRSPIVPFASLAGGVVSSSPNADTFLLKSGSVSAASAGFGLRIGFRYRLTLRLEARSYVLFQADRYVPEEEFSAGLTVFF